MDQLTQLKARYSESGRRGSKDRLAFIVTGKEFLYKTAIAQTFISTINKVDFLRLKICAAKDTTIQAKQPIEWNKP